MEQFQYRDHRDDAERARDNLRVDDEDVYEISMLLLAALDAAWRGCAGKLQVNILIEHVLTAFIIWTKTGNDVLQRRGQAGYLALQAAIQAQPGLVHLHGKQYTDVRNVVSAYLQRLVGMRARDYVSAYRMALQKLDV